MDERKSIIKKYREQIIEYSKLFDLIKKIEEFGNNILEEVPNNKEGMQMLKEKPCLIMAGKIKKMEFSKNKE